MKRNGYGFTLLEVLVVIAIITALIVIAIPTFAAQLEKSRESADIANVRSAYAQVSAEAMLGNPGIEVTVALKQKRADWQSVDPVNIGGIIHYKNQGNTDNWKGTAAPGGSCVVTYSEECGVVLTWSGEAAPSGPDYPFNTNETGFFSLLYNTDFWKNGEIKKNSNFEFDSRCTDSSFIPSILDEIGKLDNSLLQQPDCTWAFLGDGRDKKEANRYLFWTSLNTNNVKAGKQIPVIIQTGDGKYYVSETTTGRRVIGGKEYVAVSERLTSQKQYREVLDRGKEYSSLEAAYAAYLTALADSRYDQIRDS